MLSRKEMETALRRWHQAWADHDLDGVMELFHEDILFENWTGGKAERPGQPSPGVVGVVCPPRRVPFK